VRDRELRITGTKPPSEHATAHRRCHRVERSFGPFSLRVYLPAAVDIAACSATLRQGVLEVALPRLAPRPSGSVRVEVSEEEP